MAHSSNPSLHKSREKNIHPSNLPPITEGLRRDRIEECLWPLGDTLCGGIWPLVVCLLIVVKIYDRGFSIVLNN